MPTLRYAERELAELLLAHGSEDSIEDAFEVMQGAVTSRENSEWRDEHQIQLAKLRLANFLIANQRHADAHEVLEPLASQSITAPKPVWLKDRIDKALQQAASE